MGMCNSCDRENDIDREKAAQKVVEKRIREVKTNSVASSAFFTPPSVAYSRSPYVDTTQSTVRTTTTGTATTLRSFQFPSERPSESARTSEVEQFHFGPPPDEPTAPHDSGVFMIPNTFSPLNSPSIHSTRLTDCDVMHWSVAEVVSWWCEKLPDEAIQYAPLVEDTQLRGEDLLAMDLELLMSFQIDRPLAEHIFRKIQNLMKISHSRHTTTSTNAGRENTITSTTGETQLYTDPEADSVPSYWKAGGVPEETDEECESLRGPLTLLPPNSPRMHAEADALRAAQKAETKSHRIAELEQQIQNLQEKLTNQQLIQKPKSPVGKRKSSPRGVAKGRRTKKNSKGNSKILKRRNQEKFSVYKEGPVEIGRITDWSPARYDIEDNTREFLDERIPKIDHTQHYHIYKEGPRDIGRMTGDWKPYKHKRVDSGREFLAPRFDKRRNQDIVVLARKEGPRGTPEIVRKRSSISKKRKDSQNRRSGSRKSSENKSASRKNSERQKSVSERSISRKSSYREQRSASRNRCAENTISLKAAAHLTSADHRLLKMSLDCGGEMVPNGI